MQIYEVRISHGARVDMAELRKFLKAMMTVEGAIRYANNMREEIKMLALYADLYGKSTSLLSNKKGSISSWLCLFTIIEKDILHHPSYI